MALHLGALPGFWLASVRWAGFHTFSLAVQKEALLKNMLVTGMQPFSVPSAVSVPPSPTISGTPLNILDHEPRPTSLGDWQPSQTTKTREYKEVRVPSGSVDRAFQFGTLVSLLWLTSLHAAHLQSRHVISGRSNGVRNTY